MTRMPLGRRSAAVVLAVSLPVLAAACSSSSQPPATTVAPGVAVLGASFAVWVSGHPPISAGGESGFGSAVTIDGRSVPQFTDVHQLSGRVVSMHLTLPAGTHLAAAEQLVRAQVPSDARQTASWRASFSGGPVAYCEFVNYQSAVLARSLGIPPPPSSAANIGTSLYERTPDRPGSPSIVTVNSADISTAANVIGKAC